MLMAIPLSTFLFPLVSDFPCCNARAGALAMVSYTFSGETSCSKMNDSEPFQAMHILPAVS